MTKIIFMGTPDFSSPILERLAHDYNVTAVVTQPDKPVGRKKIMTPPPVKVTAQQLGIPVYQPVKLSGSEELDAIIALQPDLIVTAAYGQLLPERLLNAPALGCINVHASLLPKYRGGAPIHYSVINGEQETGVSIMYMVKQLDAGDVITQRALPIELNDTVGTVHDKLSQLGVELLLETLPSIINGTNTRTPQDESQVTFASNISRADEYVDFNRPSRAVHNQIRGLSPWPVGYANFDGRPMKLWQAELTDGSGAPGTIISTDKEGITVATADGAVLLKEIQPAGKKRMTAASFAAGQQKDLTGTVFNEG
ncbi:methionyl-tRNA formyltransferase [Macrococcus equipercicus]|uniref:Methionyl-tRNA formyltransferase n=1 Tax=Macrococcus equipercicus TaxID=69967 RepID=A0A9Q9F3S7_9STAP|nr:methionyl-tRNA formyltransferase [Macrococcus equipercicus]KAA1042743.1 methionyl-tRNA formyltransferase [Macrococcus equipercicus]UTH14609.1 methionyl-tRNA formyltransferase [Macrococcus equipercicus]